jgi:hypothetical protein
VTEPPDIAAIPPIRDYETLRKAIAAARRKSGMSQMVFDDVSGLQSGYMGKLEAGLKGFGPMSLGLVLDTLGAELRVHKKRDRTRARKASKDTRLPKRFKDLHPSVRKKIGNKKGAIRAAERLGARGRCRRARQANKIRWAKVRARDGPKE